MDALKNIIGGSSSQSQSNTQNTQSTESSGLAGGLLNKVNNMAGGGEQGEKNEDMLDKGIDLIQQHVLKQGDQSNESAVEQATDEQISDFIRGQYKNATGKEFPVADK